MICNLPEEQIRSYYQVDAAGYMRIGMHSLLIEHNERLVLIDPGCGDFLPKRILDEYGLEIPIQPEDLLLKAGYKENEVTDVIFTHLHFDHGTAAFKRVPGNIIKRYENARYWISDTHYQYAQKPVKAEKNSFFTFVFRYIDDVHKLEQWDADWMTFDTSNGHTKGMMITKIYGLDYNLVFASDLLPMRLLTESNSYSFYDVNRDLLQKEKHDFLTLQNKPTLAILYHEPDNPYLFISEGNVMERLAEDGSTMLDSFILGPS